MEYEPEKVIGFLSGVKHVLEATEYPKAPSFLCNYCEYGVYPEFCVNVLRECKQQKLV